MMRGRGEQLLALLERYSYEGPLGNSHSVRTNLPNPALPAFLWQQGSSHWGYRNLQKSFVVMA